MSKRTKNRVVLTDYLDKKEQEGAIEIELPDSTVLRIAPPALWPDETEALANDRKNVELATLLLGGDENYAKFVEAGGSAAVVLSIVQDELGATVGE